MPSVPQRVVYRYELRNAAPACVYDFTFLWGGLAAIHMRCQAEHSAQLSAMRRRYKRWYGRPSYTAEQKQSQLWEWTFSPSRVHVRLRFRGSTIEAWHEDWRTLWWTQAPALWPRQLPAQSSPSVVLWKRVEAEVRLEVLSQFGRFVQRWRRRLRSTKPGQVVLLRSSLGWLPSTLPKGCRARQTKHLTWLRPPWSELGIWPLRKLRLQYRFVALKPRRVEVKNRPEQQGFALRQYPFLLYARGCGYEFLLRGVMISGFFTQTKLKVMPVFVKRR